MKEIYNCLADRECVDDIAQKVMAWGNRVKINRKDLIRLRLSVEEVLLSLCEKFEGQKNVKITLRAKLESYQVLIDYTAQEYNPFNDQDDADEWTKNMLGKMGSSGVHSYKDGRNEVTFSIPKRRYKVEVFMIFAVVMAVICGFLGGYIPDGYKTFICEYILNLISDIFMNLLALFSGLMIFFSLVNGICGMGSVADFSKVGKTIIARYLGFSFLGGTILTFLATFFFRLQWGGAVSGSDIPKQIKEIILSIIPSSPIEPFAEGNMLQIIFLAVFLGIVLLILGNRVGGFKSFIVQGNELISKCVDILCLFLPIFIFTSLLSMFWELGFGVVVSFWKPIAVTVGLGLIIPLVKLLMIAIRYHVLPHVMISRLAKSVFVSFTTASSMASFSAIKEDLSNGLGVEEKFVGFSFPIGINMYGANYMLLYLTIVFYLAESSKTPVSIVWIAMAGLFSIIFSIATPNVSGGALICIGVMMSNLKLPQNGLALAGTIIIILDFYSTAARNFAQELEVFQQAMRFDKVDLEVLQRKRK